MHYPMLPIEADEIHLIRRIHNGEQLRNYGPHTYEVEVTVLSKGWNQDELTPMSDGEMLLQHAVKAVGAPLRYHRGRADTLPECVTRISRLLDGGMDDHFTTSLDSVEQVGSGTVRVCWSEPFCD